VIAITNLLAVVELNRAGNCPSFWEAAASQAKPPPVWEDGTIANWLLGQVSSQATDRSLVCQRHLGVEML